MKNHTSMACSAWEVNNDYTDFFFHLTEAHCTMGNIWCHTSHIVPHKLKFLQTVLLHDTYRRCDLHFDILNSTWSAINPKFFALMSMISRLNLTLQFEAGTWVENFVIFCQCNMLCQPQRIKCFSLILAYMNIRIQSHWSLRFQVSVIYV